MPAMRTSVRPATSRSVVVALVCVGILAAITTIAQRYGFSTLALDQAAVRNWLGGGGLYAYREPATRLGTALSPPAALLLAPVAFLPLPVVGWLFALAGVAALGLTLIATAGPVARRYGRRPWPVVLAVGALALTIEPIRAVLGLGTLDLLVFALVTGDLVARRTRLAGAGIGLATALSVSSALFIGYLIVTRQRRPALIAIATSAGVALVALLVMPHETAAWFGEVLWLIDRSGPVAEIGNQSLAGVLARLYESSSTPVLLWLSFGMLIAAVGLIRARAAHADGDEVAAFSLVGLTTAIIGPVSGTHELVWVLPAMVVLADVAASRYTRRRQFSSVAMAVVAILTYLLFVLAPMWSVPNAFAVNSYALALILLINALPWRLLQDS